MVRVLTLRAYIPDIGIEVAGATISISPFGGVIIEVWTVQKHGITVPIAAAAGIVKVISPKNDPETWLAKTPAHSPIPSSRSAERLETCGARSNRTDGWPAGRRRCRD